jgi:hypothetical protein
MSFRPVASTNSNAQNWNEFNNITRRLNQEQTVKTFKQPGGNAVINGKLPYVNGYGSLYYDRNNVPTIIIGILPNGETGIVVGKPGVDVINDISW